MRRDCHIDPSNNLSFRSNCKQVKLNFTDIIAIEALSDYIIIKTRETRYVTLCTMQKVLGILPNYFLRVHRSHIVNRNMVQETYHNRLHLKTGDTKIKIPVGRSFKSNLKKIF